MVDAQKYPTVRTVRRTGLLHGPKKWSSAVKWSNSSTASLAKYFGLRERRTAAFAIIVWVSAAIEIIVEAPLCS